VNARDPLEQVSPVKGQKMKSLCKEIQMAMKQMKSNTAPGPSGITAKMIKDDHPERFHEEQKAAK